MKELHEIARQVRGMVGTVPALELARDVGLLLIEAKATVKAQGGTWGQWLKEECTLTTRSAQRYMTIARRWEEPAFTAAREENPGLALREADRVLAASSTRKRPQLEEESDESFEPTRVHHAAERRLVNARWELFLLKEENGWAVANAGAEIEEARDAIQRVNEALWVAWWDQNSSCVRPSAET